MDTITLKLSPREITGRKVSQLRRQGMVPVHMYGRGIDSLPLQVEGSVLRTLIPRAARNIPIEVEIEGGKGDNVCFIREIQRHPVTEDLLHVDFMRVDVTRRITAAVPIDLQGEAPAVENMEGTLLQTLPTLEVQALPMNIPAVFTIDVTDLDDFEKSIRVSDLTIPEDVTVVNDADEMVARVIAPRLEEEEAVEEEGLEEGIEGEEGEEGVEGAAEGEEAGEAEAEAGSSARASDPRGPRR